MNKNIMSKKINMQIKKVLSSIGVFAVVAGFIFSTPPPVIKNTLVRDAAQKIQTANNNSLLSSTAVAYAQEEGGAPTQIWGCTNPSALNWNSEATDDDGSCEFSPQCDDQTALNYGASEECTYPEEVPGCTDDTAVNFSPDATVDDGSCEDTNLICCDGETPATNYTPINQRGANDFCSDFQCEYDPPICCDGNWDNYVSPGDRGPNDVCEYGPPDTCQCYGPDPLTGEPYSDPNGYAHSQCGNGGDTCEVSTGFSVIKSGIEITGIANMVKSTPCTVDDQAYLAGIAAADATPSTPLNTPIEIDPLTVYTVTSFDYCLNVDGAQSSGEGYDRNEFGFCCEDPTVVDPETGNTCTTIIPAECGQAVNSGPYETAPVADLCNSGNPSAVAESDTNYSWSCDTGTSNTSCSVERTCNGGSCATCTDLDCGVDDQCKYITGNQTNPSADGLTPDVNGYCWNSVNGACGTVHQGIPVSEAPTVNLCVTDFYGQNSSVSTWPSLNGAGDKYEWTCANSNSTVISPTCNVDYCEAGTCDSNPSANILNNTFKARPAIVRDITETCTLTWDTGVDSSISDPVQWCRLDGQDVSGTNTDGTDSTVPNSLDLVKPGTTHTLSCYIEGQGIDTESVKCSVRPIYKED